MRRTRQKSLPGNPAKVKSFSGKSVHYLNGSINGSSGIWWNRWSGDPGYSYSQQEIRKLFSASGESCTILTRIAWLEFLLNKGDESIKDELYELKEALRKDRIRKVFQ